MGIYYIDIIELGAKFFRNSVGYFSKCFGRSDAYPHRKSGVLIHGISYLASVSGEIFDGHARKIQKAFIYAIHLDVRRKI